MQVTNAVTQEPEPEPSLLNAIKRLEVALDEYDYRVNETFAALTGSLLGYSGLPQSAAKDGSSGAPTGLIPRLEDLASHFAATNRRLDAEVARLAQAVNGQGDH